MLADLLGNPMAGVTSFATARDPKKFVPALAARIRTLARRASGSRRLRRDWRRRARHGRALHDDGAACADAGLAECQSARAAVGGDRSAGADRELRPRLRAGAGLGDACRHSALRGSRVRQRLRRRRRRRDHPRRSAARPPQHRRRIRPRAAVARWPALLVRIERLLGSVRLEPRDARALLRPDERRRSAAGRCRDQRSSPSRTSSPERAPATPRRWPRSRRRRGISGSDWRRSSTRSIPPASTSAAKSRWPGTCIEGTVRAALAERALTPAAAETEIRPVAATEYPRLQGAAALVAAPAFAAPVVA